jgi:hypothetical protein
MNVQFGTGVLSAIPNAGNLAANPSPQNVGILQDAQIDFAGDIKELFGQSQMPVSTARGKLKVTGKAKLALLDPGMLNQIYFGQAQSTGVNRFVYNESHVFGSVISTVPVTNLATFNTDYGVIGGTTGRQFIKVLPAATPLPGQYKNTGGTYTFAAAETELSVLISYTWTDVTTGTTITLNNQLMGYAPYCQMILYNGFRNELFAIEMFSCVLGKISLPTKQEDYWIMDIDWTCNVNAAGILGKIYADF